MAGEGCTDSIIDGKVESWRLICSKVTMIDVDDE